MKTPIIAGIIIVLLIIIAALAMNKNNATDSPDTTTTDDVSVVTDNLTTTDTTATPTSSATTITYTNSGYSPKTLTVKAGTTVNFVNNSNKSMWTASNPHPTHTQHSEFDALKGYKAGETYSFTFTKAGTYGFHNHLDSSDSGTITVE